ncbi:MAG: NADH-quinone oxidoreductase subunit [Pyrinomonadaceae bacterium]|jgi:NADH-quinone oxidoreductase subunit J|nr:NADH-quinone oxidoreductase subunit [Pyrinomonadaceae bacterium]
MTLTGWEAVFFWVFAVAALVAALLTILARNAVHSALFLISTLVAVAALFVLLGAEFIAGVQILVYVGGVMVLFLFVIMLVNVGAEERGNEMLFNRPAQVATSAIFLVLLSLGFIYAIRQGYEGLLARDNLITQDQREESATRRRARQQDLRPSATGTSLLSTDTQLVGASLYRFAALPFEIASVLLLVAIIGSVMLARTTKQEAATDDLETARDEGLVNRKS